MCTFGRCLKFFFFSFHLKPLIIVPMWLMAFKSILVMHLGEHVNAKNVYQHIKRIFLMYLELTSKLEKIIKFWQTIYDPKIFKAKDNLQS